MSLNLVDIVSDQNSRFDHVYFIDFQKLPFKSMNISALTINMITTPIKPSSAPISGHPPTYLEIPFLQRDIILQLFGISFIYATSNKCSTKYWNFMFGSTPWHPPDRYDPTTRFAFELN